MEIIHGILEWVPLVLFALVGLPLDRFVPAQRPRCAVYAVFLIAAFVMDLNKATFRYDLLDGIFWALLLVAISELFWVCVRKKSKFLLCGALVMLVPVFVYIYFALLMVMPMPCHEDKREFVDRYECPAGNYVLRKRLSFDIFEPAQVYVLYRQSSKLPFETQVDKFPAPKGYMEAKFEPRWSCLEGKYRGGVKVDLYIDGYTLWSLKEEPKNN